MPSTIMLVRRRFHWPEAQLNFWLIFMLSASACSLGFFAWFISLQQTLKLGIPWYFPYMVTVGSLGVVFIVLIIVLVSQRSLLPGIVMLGTFIMFVLFLTGLIETSIVLFGSSGNVNSNCSEYVTGQAFSGQSVDTLAYLTQLTICNVWKAAFAWEIIGTVFLVWMFVMAWQVQQDMDE